MNLETARVALTLLEREEAFALATILNTHGSSPRHSGASMVVRADGSITGTIGGGPLEAMAIREALDALRARRTVLCLFDSSELGIMCGGDGLLLVEYLDPSQGSAKELLGGISNLLRAGHKGWLVTVVASMGDAAPARETAATAEGAAPAVRRCLVGPSGATSGDPVCSPEVLGALSTRGGPPACVFTEGAGTVYVQQIGAQGTAYVFGAGHCGEKLIPVLASIGFSTVIVDDRPEFANAERFPTAARILVAESFSGVVGSLPIDEQSYVVIMTRGHHHDRDVLAQALRTPARYIGMIGSENKVAQTFDLLLREGFSTEDLARVHAPIGLKIGAETPEEIAISVAAQLIQARAATWQV